jgi:hypothetical protein
VKAGFSRVRSDHPVPIPLEWPSIEDENALVVKASRQFVYVSLVVKHLTNPRRNPVLELRHILNHQSSECDTRANPFSELDALYNRILHPPDVDISLLKSILHAIIHQTFYSFPGIDTVLDLAPGTAVSTVFDLYSVIKVEPQSPIGFHHKSLEDFLTSPSRAGGLYASGDLTHMQLTLEFYQLCRRQQMNIGPSQSWNSGCLMMYHASSVSDWSIFGVEFSTHTIPSFIEEWFIEQACFLVQGWREKRIFNAISEYSRVYHSFHVRAFCSFKGRFFLELTPFSSAPPEMPAHGSANG